MSETHVTVIGGGFSALTSAYFLKKAGFNVSVRNPQEEWGGLMQTIVTPHGLVERGPNAIIADSLVEGLAQEIGLELYPHKKAANKKYIYNKGFRRFPVGFGDVFSLVNFGIKYKFFKSSLKPKEDENLYQWGKRTLGENVTKNIISVVVQGIYATDAKKLSAELIVPHLLGGKSVPRGQLKGSISPRWGMGDWIKGLCQYLERADVNLIKNSKLENQPKGLTVLATSLKGAKNLLGNWGDHRGFLLNKIKLIDLVTVTIFLKPSGNEKKGFGCLFPRGQGILSSGVVFNDCVFSDRVSQGLRSETWILSSELIKGDMDILNMENQEILEIVLNDRRKCGLGTTELVHYEVNKWPEAIPLYSTEMKRILDLVPICKDSVYLHGNYLGRLGLSKILFQSRELAKKLKTDHLAKS